MERRWWWKALPAAFALFLLEGVWLRAEGQQAQVACVARGVVTETTVPDRDSIRPGRTSGDSIYWGTASSWSHRLPPGHAKGADGCEEARCEATQDRRAEGAPPQTVAPIRGRHTKGVCKAEAPLRARPTEVGCRVCRSCRSRKYCSSSMPSYCCQSFHDCNRRAHRSSARGRGLGCIVEPGTGTSSRCFFPTDGNGSCSSGRICWATPGRPRRSHQAARSGWAGTWFGNGWWLPSNWTCGSYVSSAPWACRRSFRTPTRCSHDWSPWCERNQPEQPSISCTCTADVATLWTAHGISRSPAKSTRCPYSRGAFDAPSSSSCWSSGCSDGWHGVIQCCRLARPLPDFAQYALCQAQGWDISKCQSQPLLGKTVQSTAGRRSSSRACSAAQSDGLAEGHACYNALRREDRCHTQHRPQQATFFGCHRGRRRRAHRYTRAHRARRSELVYGKTPVREDELELGTWLVGPCVRSGTCLGDRSRSPSVPVGPSALFRALSALARHLLIPTGSSFAVQSSCSDTLSSVQDMPAFLEACWVVSLHWGFEETTPACAPAMPVTTPPLAAQLRCSFQ